MVASTTSILPETTRGFLFFLPLFPQSIAVFRFIFLSDKNTTKTDRIWQEPIQKAIFIGQNGVPLFPHHPLLPSNCPFSPKISSPPVRLPRSFFSRFCTEGPRTKFHYFQNHPGLFTFVVRPDLPNLNLPLYVEPLPRILPSSFRTSGSTASLPIVQRVPFFPFPTGFPTQGLHSLSHFTRAFSSCREDGFPE